MPRYILLLLIVTASCSNNNKIPGDILTKSKMQVVIWDLIRADEFVSNYIWKNDSLINRMEESVRLYEKIFLIHKITKDEFRRSLSFYRQHPKLLKIIVDSLNSKENLQRNKTPVLLPGDRVPFKKDSLAIQ